MLSWKLQKISQQHSPFSFSTQGHSFKSIAKGLVFLKEANLSNISRRYHYTRLKNWSEPFMETTRLLIYKVNLSDDPYSGNRGRISWASCQTLTKCWRFVICFLTKSKCAIEAKEKKKSLQLSPYFYPKCS